VLLIKQQQDAAFISISAAQLAADLSAEKLLLIKQQHSAAHLMFLIRNAAKSSISCAATLAAHESAHHNGADEAFSFTCTTSSG
jgi:hypothetical protein